MKMTNLCLSMWICQFGAVPGSEIIQRVTFSVTFLAVFGHCVHCSVYQDFLTYGGIVFHRMCVTHLILSSIYGYLSCFYLWAIVNSVTLNILTQVFVWTHFSSFEYIPKSEFSGSYGNSVFSFFKEPLQCFPQYLHHLTFPPAGHWDSIFPHLG